MTREELQYLLFLLSFYSTVTVFQLFSDSFNCFKSSYSIYCCYYSHFLSFANVPTVPTVSTISDTGPASRTHYLSFFRFINQENIVPIHFSLKVATILFLLVFHNSYVNLVFPAFVLTMSHSSRPQH